MRKENVYAKGAIQPPVDIQYGPVEAIVKTEEGRFRARHMSAVVFASTQIANGVSTQDALKTSEKVLRQTGRNQIASTLTSARQLIK